MLKLLLLAVTVVRSERTTPCDVFYAEDGSELCGPSILIIGAGKCGTNKVANYVVNVYGEKFVATNRSEVEFDPFLWDPTELVRRENPGITPDVDKAWLIKCPGTYREADSELLLGRLKKAYPSAVILMTICDHTMLDFRWFRHEMRAFQDDIAGVDEYLRDAFNKTAIELYAESRPVENYCVTPKSVLDMLDQLVTHYKEEHIRLRIERLASIFWPGPRKGHATTGCIQVKSYGHYLHTILRAVEPFYELGKTFGVVVMENWQDQLGSEDNTRRIDAVIPIHGPQKPTVNTEVVLAAKQYAIPTDIERIFPTDRAWNILRTQYTPKYWANAARLNCHLLETAGHIVSRNWYTEDFC